MILPTKLLLLPMIAADVPMELVLVSHLENAPAQQGTQELIVK